MSQSLARSELLIPQIEVDKLIARLDKTDIMLLRYFYVTGKPFPDDTMGYVLKILVDEYKVRHGTGKDLSYSALRKRLENLRALGLVEKIPRTNPAIYNPIDPIANDVRRMILRFAAELVGVMPNSKS